MSRTGGHSGDAWYARWFGEDYKRLYPHRDSAQAAAQVAALLALPEVRAARHAQAPLRVLDIGCGAGRHLAALRGAPALHAFGIDLSSVLLRDARAADSASPSACARADMRRLPFTDARFDLVASFFTSFGYFDTPEEDARTLAEFCRVLRPGGLMFLDLPGRDAVVRSLVPQESLELDGRTVRITRTLEGDCVVKRIVFQPRGLAPDPEAGRTETHFERVRLYTFEDLQPVLARLGLERAAVLGDEHGGAYDPARSPRMSLLLRHVGNTGSGA